VRRRRRDQRGVRDAGARLAVDVPARRIEAERVDQILAGRLRSCGAALAVGPDGFVLVAVDPLDLECLGVVLLHVLHREVGRLEEVRALAQPRALLEAVPEGDVVDAVDRLVGLDRPERRLELDREGLGLEAVLLARSEEHTSELQSLAYLVCRLLLEKKKT